VTQVPPVREPAVGEWGLGLLFDAIKDAVVVADANTGRIVLWNRGAVGLLQYTAAEALDLRLEDLVPPALRERHKAGLAGFARTGRGLLVDADTPVELPAIRKDGVHIIVQLTLSQVASEQDPGGRYVMGLLRDVTKERESEQIARYMLDAAAQAVFGLDLQGMCTLANPAATAILGYGAEELVGRDMHLVIHHSYPDGSPYPASACPIYDALRSGTSTTVDDEVFWRADGSAFPAEYQCEPIIRAATVLGAVVTFTDMTERRRREAEALSRQLELERRLFTDELTGVGNRRHAEAVLACLRPGDAVVMIDVDHFKQVNDTLGHAAGDQVLAELAAHLLDTLRAGDSVARYGGEEFLVVLRGAAVGAIPIVRRIADLWSASHRSPTFSAGIAIHDSGHSARDTLHQADTAMYAAKRGGRNRVQAYRRDGGVPVLTALDGACSLPRPTESWPTGPAQPGRDVTKA
jgi:diguanylate cyclase (GGDEF)-like protein/PAS domain S-box-containing protein